MGKISDKQMIALFLMKKPYPFSVRRISRIIDTPRATVTYWKIKYLHVSLGDICANLRSMRGYAYLFYKGSTQQLEDFAGYHGIYSPDKVSEL
jgi:hypothetical protein